MTKAIEYKDWNYAVCGNCLAGQRTEKDENGKVESIEGRIRTLEGYVEFYINHSTYQEYRNSSLWFVHAGRMYSRRYAGILTVRGLVTKAARFVKEVVK